MTDREQAPTTYIAFVGTKCVARGALTEVLPRLKKRFDADEQELVSVFDDETGRAVDFDLRGTLADVIARETPPETRGPGRPKLGVASREVSLLPRHWDWLEQQPNGISAALRRLVDEARKHEPEAQRLRRRRAAVGNVMTAVAGDLPGYEEASRALYAGDHEALAAQMKRWPKELREYVIERALA